MGFIRENILKIIAFIVILTIMIIIFVFVFGRRGTFVKSYSNLELSLVNAARKYTNDNQKLLPNTSDEVSKVNLDTLVNENYIKDIYSIEDKNVKCSGYVEILYKNNDYEYIPYLKCGNLYETKSFASYIKENVNVVTSGDGLYKFNDTYVFRGENPKNYLLLGERLYRIIDIKDNEIRLISDKRLNTYFVWDDRYNTEKNSTIGINDYSVSRIKESLEYIGKYNMVKGGKDAIFSPKELEKISTHDICIAKRDLSNGSIDSYNECQKVEPNQKVSLITVSDYARASLDQNCKSIFDKSCVNYNYFSSMNSAFRTVTGVSNNTYQIYAIIDGVATPSRAATSFISNIVIYIDGLSLYSKGDGSYENPYIVR